MNRIKQSTAKVSPIGHSTVPRDITPDGVRIFHLKEGEMLPKNLMQDPSIHTIITFRMESVSIIKRCVEEPEIRDYVDPERFENHRVETINWEITTTYNGNTYSHKYDFPIAPLTFGKT